jgi:hypothetical protein
MHTFLETSDYPNKTLLNGNCRRARSIFTHPYYGTDPGRFSVLYCTGRQKKIVKLLEIKLFVLYQSLDAKFFKTGGSSVQDAAVRLQWGRKSRKIKWGTIDLHLDAKFFKLPLISTAGKLRSLRVWVKNGELLRTWAVKGSKGMKAPGVDLLQ